MLFEINRLIDSSTSKINEIGWLLYNREGNGLTKDELHDVIELIRDLDVKVDKSDELEEAYEKGYGVGYSVGVSEARKIYAERK